MSSLNMKPSTDKGKAPRGRSAVSRVWVDVIGQSRGNKSTSITPIVKQKPLWLKPRNSSAAPGPPPPKKGDDWKYAKHTKAWSNTFQGRIEQDTVCYERPLSPSPRTRTLETYVPLSRKYRALSSVKMPTTPSKPKGAPISRPTTPSKAKGAPISKPTIPSKSKGALISKPTIPSKSKGALISKPATPSKSKGAPRSKCLLASCRRPRSPVASCSWAQSSEYIVASASRPYSPVASTSQANPPDCVVASTSMHQSHKKPNTSKPSGSRYWNCSKIPDYTGGASQKKLVVKRPKAYVAPKVQGSEYKDQIVARRKQQNQLVRSIPVDDVQIYIPVSLPKARKPKEVEREEEHRIQDVKDSKMSQSVEDSLRFPDGNNKQSASLPRGSETSSHHKDLKDSKMSQSVEDSLRFLRGNNKRSASLPRGSETSSHYKERTETENKDSDSDFYYDASVNSPSNCDLAD